MAQHTKRPLNAAEAHRSWLQLIDTERPLLAVAPLKRIWPQGIATLTAERKEILIETRKDFEPAWSPWTPGCRSPSSTTRFYATTRCSA